MAAHYCSVDETLRVAWIRNKKTECAQGDE